MWQTREIRVTSTRTPAARFSTSYPPHLLASNWWKTVLLSQALVYQTMPALRTGHPLSSASYGSLAKTTIYSPYAHRATTTHVSGDVTTRRATSSRISILGNVVSGQGLGPAPQMSTGAVDPERTCMTLKFVRFGRSTALLSAQIMSLRLSHVCAGNLCRQCPRLYTPASGFRGSCAQQFVGTQNRGPTILTYLCWSGAEANIGMYVHTLGTYVGNLGMYICMYILRRLTKSPASCM